VSIPSPADALTGVRVLIVEDDAAIAEQLVRGLRRAGCEPQSVSSGADADKRLTDADLVLLDLGLPDADGVDVCARLRRRSDIPIIVVTARSEEGERVAALDSGADDYVVKPFGFDELMARMRAVLRRASDRTDAAVVVAGPLRIDVGGRHVWVDDAEVALTPKEFDILACLASEPGRVVGRDEIFERVWDEHWYGPTKVLDVHLAALRRKLRRASLIETVYGRGFRLAAR
jgi:DNA-binding response OmpR family regulator